MWKRDIFRCPPLMVVLFAPLLLALFCAWESSQFGAPEPSLMAAVTDGQESAALRAILDRPPQGFKWDKKRDPPAYFQFSYGDLHDAIKNNLAAETGRGKYDIVIVDNPWIAEFREGLLPLSPTDLDRPKRFYPKAWQTQMSTAPHTGDVPLSFVGVPYVGNVQLLCVNQDIYRRGLPTSWNDIIDASHSFRPPVYGFAIQAGNDESDIVDDYMPFLRSLDNDFGKALKLIAALGLASPPQFVGFNGFETATMLMEERAGAGIVFSGWALSISQLARHSNLRFMPLPGTNAKPEFGVWFLAIPKNAPHIDKAKEFIRLVTDRDQMTEAMWRYQNPPTRNDLDVSVCRSLEKTDRKACKTFFTNASEVLRVLPKAFADSQVRPECPNWRKSEVAMGKAIRSYQEGETDYATAVSTIRQAYLRCTGSPSLIDEALGRTPGHRLPQSAPNSFR